jgi:hypothetical protein
MEFNLLDYQTKMDGYKILLYYKGPFDEIILSKIGNYLRTKFPASPKATSKLFAIFIELAQNICYYSAETDIFDEGEKKHGIGTVVIIDNGDKFKLVAGNMVFNDTVLEIISKCEEIRSLDQHGLRQLKKEVRSAPRREGHKGGNIGLIQIAIKSDHPINVEAKKFNEDLSFVTLSAFIDKEV